ncbi:hypothetical protein HPB48_019921 [Haemaphysalis longicornis]|uniref:LRRCT domain-containing protein n=1 Tax=Haemaphysalis longicornis TaxID=44386 RepID=A0A9J6FRM5_HAELO|nr:hypothetical protein HPB48_019921 [Haemaphysalis longicornis]
MLDLSGNKIPSVSAKHFNGFQNLQALNLSRNRIIVIADDSFASLGQLIHLDLSQNPLFTISTAFLQPLKTLETLNLRNCSLARVSALPLKRGKLNTDLLWGNSEQFKTTNRRKEETYYSPNRRFLTSLRATSYGSVRSFRLQELVSRLHSLRRVLVEVEEPVLSHQLQWAFGAKLTELTVTGRQLRVVFPDALLGLHGSHELVLRLTGTSIRRLPAGLLRYLADVRYLTLDLRDNLLSSIGPEVLKPAGEEAGLWRGTQHLAGIRLEGNPWVCDCRLLWLSRWLRRWLRETLRVQMLHFDAAIYVHNLARQSECVYPSEQIRKPLIDLQEDDLQCTSPSGHPSFDHFWLLVLVTTTAGMRAS